MFGFRPIQDLTVTRFYTERQIYDAMRRMHESDTALRAAIERDPDAPIIFIQRDGARVIECNPNKILLSNTTTLRPFKRILPIGFQTDYAVRTAPAVQEIDRILEDISPVNGSDAPVDIPLTLALDLLSRIEPTLIMAEDEGYAFDWDAARAALAHMSNSAANPANRGHVWCLVRRNRNLSQMVAAGSHSVYADAPDTTRTEGAVGRQVAIDSPMLMMIRQNGLEENGWRGTPFYWPVIVSPAEPSHRHFRSRNDTLTPMARKKTNGPNGTKPAASDSIASLKYPAKRKNIPPAGLEAQGTIQEAPKLRFEYNPHLPPVLRSATEAAEADQLPDPTCGSGTTAFVAEHWGRRWITCDTSRVALALARQRLMTARLPFYQLRELNAEDLNRNKDGTWIAELGEDGKPTGKRLTLRCKTMSPTSHSSESPRPTRASTVGKSWANTSRSCST